MPNWVRNAITISGENAEQIIKQHTVVNEDGSRDFDFNSIIKMPEELLIEAGSRNNDGMKLYIAKLNPAIKNFGNEADKLPLPEFNKQMRECFGEKAADAILLHTLRPDEVDALKQRYSTTLDEVVGLGEKVFNNTRKYKHGDWYSWSCENWGTKWNACETSIEGPTVYFDTAWAPPVPVILKLSEMYPDVKIKHVYSEEQVGIFCGDYTLQNSEIIDGNIQFENESKEAFETHFELWGGRDDFKYDAKKKTYVYIGEQEM